MSPARPQFTRGLLHGKPPFVNHSPWLTQLRHDRPIRKVSKDINTDIAIVGAGIAGVSTAYFVLRNTSSNVVLLEGYKVAHGATGHNAGQLVSYFERQVSSLAKEFGLDLTAQAQREIDSTWTLIDQLFAETGLTTPLAQFEGYAGCQDLAETEVHLENIKACIQAKIAYEPMLIADDAPFLPVLEQKYAGLFTTVSRTRIQELLETKHQRYVAVVVGRKGVMNSALFCEDLLAYLLTKYADRFQVYENSPVSQVTLQRSQATLLIRKKYVVADKVVLCTNGFENFTIINTTGPEINRRFHHMVRGTVGYMAAYIESAERPPVAISYLPSHSSTGNRAFDEDPYFYLTRRHINQAGKAQNLICVGGPESPLEEMSSYTFEHPYPQEAQRVIDEFLRETYAFAPEDVEYVYKWHGLMGYTPNGVRCVGADPVNPVLLYNLGCNGVGILPSIYGGERISRLLAGEKLAQSIFDPPVYPDLDLNSGMEKENAEPFPTSDSTHILP